MSEHKWAADISDPEVYWPMATYALRVQRMLMSLRHLYAPHEALLWIASPQPLLALETPAALLATPEGTAKVDALIARILDGAYI